MGTPQTCFVDGNTIDVVYPEVLTNADGTSYGVNGAAAALMLASPQTLPTGSYAIYDPNGTLSVTVKVFTVTVVGGGGVGTDFEISVRTGTKAGTTGNADDQQHDSTPFLVLQNLRFDVVPVCGWHVAAGSRVRRDDLGFWSR